MATISLCMIVKNEEEVLGRCLDSAKSFADEIIIVDTGSTDRTKEIAAEYTDQVYDFEWTDDFSAARNESFAHATMDYCMWLDADDMVTGEQQEKLIKLKDTISSDTAVVMMKYVMGFDSDDKPTFSYYRERLLKNGCGFRWQGRVHEAIAPAGKVVYSEIEIEHRKKRTGEGHSRRNLDIYRKMKAEQAPFTPRDLFYYGRELYYFAAQDSRCLQEAKTVLSSFLDRADGWVENKIEACRFLSLCWRLEGNEEEALKALLFSFFYDRPRAEICCDIGDWFFRREEYRTAAFWYSTALNTEKDEKNGGFVSGECYDYIPALQLTVCFYRLGETDKAEACNELAGQVKPDSEAYLYNCRFFREEREKAQKRFKEDTDNEEHEK